MRLAKANVDSMCNMMAVWCEAPLFQRKGDKKGGLLNLEVGGLLVALWHV